MGGFLHWTDTGADHGWGLSTLKRPPRPGGVAPRTPRGPRLAILAGGPTQAVPPPPLEGGCATLPGRPPAGAPLGPGPPPGPPSRSSRPAALDRRVLLVEGWDDEAEGSGGHWVGITHGGSIRCLPRGDRPLAPPKDPHAAAAVLASIPRVYAVWYAVLPAPGAPQPPPQHHYSRAEGDAHARAWLAVRELVAAWRRRRGVQVVFHAP